MRTLVLLFCVCFLFVTLPSEKKWGVEGFIVRCQSFCPALYRPVCGTDGRTYQNRCYLRKATCLSRGKIRFKHSGRCGLVRSCPKKRQGQCLVFEPNQCTADRHCRRYGRHVRCCQDICSKKCYDTIRKRFISGCHFICPKNIALVCGTNGRTYRNTCFLKVATCRSKGRIRFKHNGRCGQGPTCRTVRCGWGARCVMRNGKPFCDCNRACTRVYLPVCGTDRKTYSNACVLSVATCKSRGRIRLKHKGKCGQGPTCLTVLCGWGARCVMRNGKPFCDCNRACTRVYRPVCGTDRKTYSNACVLSVATCKSRGRIRLKHKGKCGQGPTCRTVLCGWGARCVMRNGKPFCDCNRACTRVYRPVCGTDRKTYSNACVLSVATCKSRGRIRLKHKGKCGQGPTCRTVLCGWGARCVMRNGKPFCDCNRACTRVYRPVCGTDRKTYSNACVLSVATCKSRGRIRLKHKGKCGQGPTCRTVRCGWGARCVMRNGKPICDCSRACLTIYRPVCGTDRKTYSNACVLSVATCKSRGRIRLKHKGKCGQGATCRTVRCGWGARCVMRNGKPFCDCNRACLKIYRPVCGTDKRTYSNACVLSVATCKSRGRIRLKHKGKCGQGPTCRTVRCGWGARCVMRNGKPFCDCNRACTRVYRPVCGTDKKTYSNACVLSVATCKSRGRIRLKHKGKCGSMKLVCPPASRRPCLINPPPPNQCSAHRHCRGKHVLCCQDVCNRRCYNTKTKKFLPACGKFCPLYYRPVCGTNGRTYSNKCFLNIASCKSGGRIRLKRYGRCRGFNKG